MMMKRIGTMKKSATTVTALLLQQQQLKLLQQQQQSSLSVLSSSRGRGYFNPISSPSIYHHRHFSSSSGAAATAPNPSSGQQQQPPPGPEQEGTTTGSVAGAVLDDATTTAKSIVQWVTSSSSPSSEEEHNRHNPPPPHITTRFSFKKHQSPNSSSNNNNTISIQIVDELKKSKAKQQQQQIHLSPAESLAAAIKLLTPLLDGGAGQTTPIPLQANNLNSSNLLRKLQSPPPLTIEFSSPNIAKPLHMGHLRSTITGSFIKNIAQFAGHDCRSVCFLGDWGRQFGVLRGGVEEEIGKGQERSGGQDGGSVEEFTRFIESLELHDLLQIYVKASNRVEVDADFKNDVMRYSLELEESFDDREKHSTNKGYILWEHTRKLTISHLQSCYATLNIQFDAYEGESEFRKGSDHTRQALELMLSKGLCEKHEDGSVRQVGKESNNILVKKDGSSIYLLRDVACALRRLEGESGSDPRRFVYVVDSGQGGHFKDLFQLLKGLGVSKDDGNEQSLPFSSTHTHIPFNRVGGMSTRSGNFTLLSQVISEGTQLMHDSRAKSKNARNTDDIRVSEQLAVSGLIINSLKMRRGKTYDFDWGEALRSNGNSGVALQYTLVRLRSLFNRVREEIGVDGGWDCTQAVGERELGVLFGGGQGAEEEGNKRGVDELVELVVCLMNFEDTFWKSYTQLEPCILVSYSFNLSDKISRVLGSLRIIDGYSSPDPDMAELCNAALWALGISERVLHACMEVIVGVKVVEGEGF